MPIRRRAPTEAEKERIRKAIAEESRPEVMAATREQVRKLMAKTTPRGTTAQRVIDLLRHQKDEQKLTLADLQERTGINSGNLSRLLNADEPNLTLDTAERLATAMHCSLNVTLEPDRP